MSKKCKRSVIFEASWHIQLEISWCYFLLCIISTIKPRWAIHRLEYCRQVLPPLFTYYVPGTMFSITYERGDNTECLGTQYIIKNLAFFFLSQLTSLELRETNYERWPEGRNRAGYFLFLLVEIATQGVYLYSGRHGHLGRSCLTLSASFCQTWVSMQKSWDYQGTSLHISAESYIIFYFICTNNLTLSPI